MSITISLCRRMAAVAATALLAAAITPASAATFIYDSGYAEELAKIAEESGTPGISAAYFTLGSDNIYVAAAGVRRAGDTAAVTVEDRFNVASNTKPIISTIFATLVRDGKLSWDTTLAEALPELADSMHPDFKNRTIRQALTMRAGIDPLYTLDKFEGFDVNGDTAQEERLDATQKLLSQEPYNAAGEQVYSNGSYIVLATIIEQKTGMSWEEAQQTLVFEPLGISGSTGWPAENGVDAPWGHIVVDGVVTALSPEDTPAFAAYAQPAGDLSTTAGDLAIFARAHLAGLNGVDTGLGLDQESYEIMHASDGFIAMPWGQQVNSDGRVSLMIGSTDVFFAAMTFNRDTGVGAVYLANGELGEPSYPAMLAGLDAGLARAGAVPEPASWAMMIAGFGMCGLAMRRRRPIRALA